MSKYKIYNLKRSIIINNYRCFSFSNSNFKNFIPKSNITNNNIDEINDLNDISSLETGPEFTSGGDIDSFNLPTAMPLNPQLKFTTARERSSLFSSRIALLNALRASNYSSAWNIYKSLFRKGVMTKHYLKDNQINDNDNKSSINEITDESTLDIKNSLLERGDHSLMLWCAVYHEVPEVGNKLSQFVFNNIRNSGYEFHLSDAKALMWLALRSRDAMRAYFILVSCHHHNIQPDVEILKISMACFAKARQLEMVEGCWKDIMKIPAGVGDPDAWSILIRSRARCGDFDGALEAYQLLEKLSYSNEIIIQHALLIAYGYMGDINKIQQVRDMTPPLIGTLKCEVEAYRRAGDFEKCLRSYAHIKSLPIFIPNASYHLFRMVSNSMDLLRLFYEEGLFNNQQCLTILTERLLIEEHYDAGLYHLYMMITRMVPLTPMLQKARDAAGITEVEKRKVEYTIEEGLKFYKYDPTSSEIDWNLLNKYSHELTRSKLL